MEELVGGPHVWRGRGSGAARSVVPTGFAALDRVLPGGGWPWGAVIEIFAERPGIGELRLWMPAIAASSRARDRLWIVFVAPPLIPYPPALARCGIDLDRVLLVDTRDTAAEASWATEQSVRSGACIVVLAWLRSVDDTALRRFQLAAEAKECALLLFRPMAGLARRSPAALRLRLTKDGDKTRVEILKCRGGRPARVDLDLDLGDGDFAESRSACASSRAGESRCG
ncbi:MAG TPA: translesion DNA synthesis-associated protein ImuA [Gammaproteobacteria bacterium]|nr:translesion DNA synthesis-associated protein ImuA [Gammaproteobacteria bacterium]